MSTQDGTPGAGGLGPAERRYVLENCHRVKDAALAAALTRLTGRRVSVHQVRRVRYGAGVAKAPGHGVCEVVRAPAGAGLGLSVSGGPEVGDGGGQSTGVVRELPDGGVTVETEQATHAAGGVVVVDAQ